MRNIIIPALLLTFFGCGQAQENHAAQPVISSDTSRKPVEIIHPDYSPTFENAHPNARKLMNDPFFFSPIEETAPFGSYISKAL